MSHPREQDLQELKTALHRRLTILGAQVRNAMNKRNAANVQEIGYFRNARKCIDKHYSLVSNTLEKKDYDRYEDVYQQAINAYRVN